MRDFGELLTDLRREVFNSTITNQTLDQKDKKETF